MAWKKSSIVEQRFGLVRQMTVGKVSVVELCQRFGVSRQTAYKWSKRYQRGGLGALADKSRRPWYRASQTAVKWLRRVRRLRCQHPTWGARKLRHKLVVRWAREREAPSTASISRWLRRWGFARGRRRQRRGPKIFCRALHHPRACHEVWTVDFKGWYRTANGQRVEPLTVRDLYSRYVLGAPLLTTSTTEATRKEFIRIFKKHGVPCRIRCDNGRPFGGAGPRGLTRLSAWWVKLGIQVEFITPGRPCENGAHEQFHRVYKAEVARQAEENPRKQQARSQRWLRSYNHERPHEGLGMKTPAAVYRKNRRRMKAVRPWKYPRHWERRWVRGNGEISHRGVLRFVGEALERDYVGLKRIGESVSEVYFGPLLVGELHEKESGRIRMAREDRRR